MNNRACFNIPVLKRALAKAWPKLDQNEVARACNLFPEEIDLKQIVGTYLFCTIRYGLVNYSY